jgi:hypothetical protein
MISSIKCFAFGVAFSLFHTTFAAPALTSARVPEVHPGPTLPSLESLGWNQTYINSLPDPVLQGIEPPITLHFRGTDIA